MAAVQQDFLSNDFSHPHHRRGVTIMILAVIIFGLLIIAYLYRVEIGQQGGVPMGSDIRTGPQPQVVSELSASAPVSVSDADKKKIVQRMSRPSSGLSNAQKSDIISQLQVP